MKSAIYSSEEFQVGQHFVVECISPTTPYLVVFEDDGSTGYFYTIDTRLEQSMLDALNIYNVENVTDKHIPSLVQIVWSGDGMKSLLMINNYPHAIFDFEAKRGYCRSNFPPPDTNWTEHSHEWDEDALSLFQD